MRMRNLEGAFLEAGRNKEFSCLGECYTFGRDIT